jgi:hypothetical protein
VDEPPPDFTLEELADDAGVDPRRRAQLATPGG